MPDFRVSDTASEHPKLRAAGLAAFGLWAAAGSWCMNPAHLTDGWVPLYYVQSWSSGKKLAKKLVEVGLWSEETRDSTPGFRYHDWTDIQRSRSSIEDEKRKARDRMARVRSGSVRANKERTFDRTGPEGSANVHDSLTLTLTHTPSGDLGGEVTNAPRGFERPPAQCPRHRGNPNAPACGACADARRSAESWDDREVQRAEEIGREIDQARTDPRMRCSHGADGGLYIHPVSGKSATCAHCRRAQEAS
ncbi:hypothetical protein [Amycolatopsis dendrobii]|uniref:Uncharacterized protein n=1 Tax=Amycolatopsis dendrobii TaxID=2760662 RepID=A0A7W3ZAK9_9PSEU|nr:hypothetical protein [Amycolatopsis dendrobii]MBB1153972.1 hypothetical protein [Amycolatopsis dendrobii]